MALAVLLGGAVVAQAQEQPDPAPPSDAAAPDPSQGGDAPASDSPDSAGAPAAPGADEPTAPGDSAPAQ
ncbi:MAG: hypothetical protein AAGC55_09220, partial [Myxococcota bacterium]